MSMSTFEEDMEEYEEQWDEAKGEVRYRELPEGVYQARIAIFRLETAPWDPNPWTLYVEFEDLGGKGTQPMRYDLEHPIGADLAKRIITQLGWPEVQEKGSLKKLRSVIESGLFDDVICEIRVRDKPGEERVFKQVFINKVLGKGAPGDSPGDFPPVDDDIPF